MTATLEDFDRITAAGILARAAVYIEDGDNPAGALKLPGEGAIREALFAEVRRVHGIAANDQSPKTLERVGDALDIKRDSLFVSFDSRPVLLRLSNKGELPSDLYQIEIIEPIGQFHGRKFLREKELIERTVRLPDQEQHYGPPETPEEPFLISLFAKAIPNQYPLRSFTMLVAGQRNGLVLNVHQAWRIYPTIVNLDGISSLVEILSRFADVFGAEIQVGDQKGHFIRVANLPKNEELRTTFNISIPILVPGKKSVNRTITVTSFVQRNPLGETNQAALIIGIDLNRYRDVLASHGW